jgi:hypothetical protein
MRKSAQRISALETSRSICRLASSVNRARGVVTRMHGDKVESATAVYIVSNGGAQGECG